MNDLFEMLSKTIDHLFKKGKKRKGKWFAHKHRKIQGPSVDPKLLVKFGEKTQIDYFGTSHVLFESLRGKRERVTELLLTVSVSLSGRGVASRLSLMLLWDMVLSEWGYKIGSFPVYDLMAFPIKSTVGHCNKVLSGVPAW